MANPNALIVEVVGDTTRLTKGLKDAETQMKRFASRSRIKSTGADKMLGDVRGMQTEASVLSKRLGEVDTTAASAGASLGRFAAGTVVAGIALRVIGNNLAELGGEGERFNTALGKLQTGNLIGFYKVTHDNTAAVAAFTKKLVEAGDAAKSTKIANEAAARGFDEVAASARAATLQLLAVQAAQAAAIIEPGEGLLGRSGGKSTVTTRKGKPLTAEQRRGFFDTRIGRALNRVQDVKTVGGQVSALRKIAGEIQNRIEATKDITRRLNLEDQLLEVNRRIEDTQTNFAADAAARAKERADAEKERTKRLREAAAARQQSRQFVALGLSATGGDVVPRVANLNKQLEQLTSRSDIGSLSSKMKSALAGVRSVLKGEFGKVTAETRSSIADLYDEIRQALDEGGNGRPLTKTTQLSERILAGLGLSAADSRILKARLSHFNSAGTALAGAGAGTINVNSTIVMDSRVVARSTTKQQRRAQSVNPSPRNGPNPGRYD